MEEVDSTPPVRTDCVVSARNQDSKNNSPGPFKILQHTLQAELVHLAYVIYKQFCEVLVLMQH